MNQEHSKKSGAAAGDYSTQPSKAPRQDESAADRPEADAGQRKHGYHPDDRQGISNRPSKDEHAFPDPDGPRDEERGAVELTEPPQTGGNRGGV
jgi:hypothetical protein